MDRSEWSLEIAAGTVPAPKLMHARIVLKADQGLAGPGWVDERIAEVGEVSQPTVARVRQQSVESGLDAALNWRAPRRQHHRKLDDEQAARMVTLACREPPAGPARWTLCLVADELVEVEVGEHISSQTVRRVLNKRVEAVAKTPMVHSAPRRRRVCVAPGRRVGFYYERRPSSPPSVTASGNRLADL